eukprot:11409058-Alexandrium_andersonii.AAC.2
MAMEAFEAERGNVKSALLQAGKMEESRRTWASGKRPVTVAPGRLLCQHQRPEDLLEGSRPEVAPKPLHRNGLRPAHPGVAGRRRRRGQSEPRHHRGRAVRQRGMRKEARGGLGHRGDARQKLRDGRPARASCVGGSAPGHQADAPVVAVAHAPLHLCRGGDRATTNSDIHGVQERYCAAIEPAKVGRQRLRESQEELTRCRWRASAQLFFFGDPCHFQRRQNPSHQRKTWCGGTGDEPSPIKAPQPCRT